MGTCFSRGLINNIFPVWNFIHFLRCFMCSFPLCVVFVFHGFSFRSAVSLSLHLHTGFPGFPFPCVVCTHSITRPCKCMPFLFGTRLYVWVCTYLHTFCCYFFWFVFSPVVLLRFLCIFLLAPVHRYYTGTWMYDVPFRLLKNIIEECYKDDLFFSV